MVGFSDRELAALVNTTTAENIQGFPRTAATLDRMSSAAADRVLLALGLSTNGTLEEKRDKIRVAIGLKLNPA
jgi:hypothetical protein